MKSARLMAYSIRGPKEGAVSVVPFAPLLAVPAVPLLLLFWLMHPTVLQNPGMSAYKAPPATRLEPLPLKDESLEDPEPPQDVLTNFAEDYAQSEFTQDDAQERGVKKLARQRLGKKSAKPHWRRWRGCNNRYNPAHC